MDTTNIESGHRLLAETIVAASMAMASPSERTRLLADLRNKLDCAASHYESGFAEEVPSSALLTFHNCGNTGDRIAVDFDHHAMSRPQYKALLVALNSSPIREVLSEAVRRVG